MVYWDLFITFFKIGLFSFGGGYAMISLIQHEVVEVHQWMNLQEFTDIVALSQVTPGPISINAATYIGYTATGGSAWGSIFATIAVALPSLIIVITLCSLMNKMHENKYVTSIFKFLRPAIVGLIAAAALLLMNGENFIDYTSVILFVAAFILVFFFRVHPILMIVLAGVTGLIIY